MASPSFPFLFSTTAPAPASGISPAAAYAPYIFPSAATLHNYSSPVFYSPPYAFPSAAAYPTPAPGFFPTPSYESSPGASHGRPPDPNYHYAAVYPPPPPGFVPVPASPTPTREHPQPHPTLHTSASKVAAAPTQAQLEEEISGRLPREVLSIQKRLDRQQSSVDRLQIDISSLTEVVAQIGVALGKQPAPSTAPNSPAPTPKPVTTTQSAASVCSEFYGALSLQSSLCGRPKLQQHKEGGSGDDLTMGSNTSGTSINGKKLIHKQPGSEILSMGHAGSTYDFAPAPSPVFDLDKSYGWQPEFQQGTTLGSPALHVFGEMPTPNFLQETHGTDPKNCSRHHNPIQNSGVSNNISEQNLDIMPQQYDFHNLTRRTVFRADGSDQSYFTLPADYLLERVPMPVFDHGDETKDCSKVFVEVPASSPEKQTKSDNAQFAACVNNVTDYAFHDNATTIHVPHFSVGESIECSRSNKIELTSLPHSEPCGKYVKAQVHNQQLNMLQSEKREEWDPGIWRTLMEISQVAKWSSFTLQLRDPSRNVLMVPDKRTEGDPGDKKIHDLPPVAADATKLQCREVYRRSDAFGLGCTEVNAAALPVLAVPHSAVTSLAKHSLILLSQDAHEQEQLPKENEQIFSDCNKVPNAGQIFSVGDSSLPRQQEQVHQIHTQQWHMMLITEGIQDGDPGIGTPSSLYFCLRGLIATSVIGKQLSQLQISELEKWESQVTSVSYAWDPGVKISLYKWFNILTVWTAADKQLSCTHIPDLAAWQNQSVGGAASYIWDPGTLLWYKFIWWLITKCKAMNSQLYWHEDIKFIGIALWLITFNPP